MIHIYITNIKDRVPSDFQSVTGQPFSQNDKFSQQRRDDARNKLKKLSRDESLMRLQVDQCAARDREVWAEAERRAAFLAKIKEGIRGLVAKIDERNENKDTNFALILDLQMRYIYYT